MKYRLAAALLLALPSAALAQEETPAIAIEEPPAATVPAADPETVKKAEALIAEVSKTYKDAKTLTDSIQMKIDSPMGSQTQEMQIAIGEGSDAKLSFPGMSMTALDGKVYIVRDDVADKYMTAPLQGNLGQTLQSIFPGFPLPPQFAFRTDASATEKLGSLSLGMLENPQITGYQTAKSEEGKTTHLIDFAAGNGKGSAHIDDETKLVRRVMMEMQPPGAPPEIKLSAAITMSPKISQTLETPIAFSAGDRKAVDSLEALEPTPIKVGEAAPDFTLPTLEGEPVTLSKLQGSVVVLDFWATWCGPCRKGLPLLQEFASWAETSGHPIKVYAVDVWERVKSPDERKAKVKEFWTAQKYTMPTLLDLDDSVVGKYGFSGIPATVIVSPDGKVFRVHDGFSPDMVDTLKKDVAEALKTTG